MKVVEIFLKIQVFLQKPKVIILILWLALTLINLNKAYHIDDTFHLEAAAWIKDHPATPMSGLVNWEDDPTPLYTHNQPPLFFFSLALVSSFTGTSEIWLHLYLSVFSLIALIFFYRLTAILHVKRRILLLILFALNPAFVVNQNLMTDIPILAILLTSTYFTIKASKIRPSLNYFFASLLLGLGLLIKYSLLPLLLAFLIIILLRRHYRYLVYVLIPVAFLLLWSFWNMAEFGSVHFLGRPGGEIHINRFWSFMACMGSVAVFSLPFISGMIKGVSGKVAVVVFILLTIATLPIFLMNWLPEDQFNLLLNYLFIANGLVVYFSVFYIFIPGIKRNFQIYIQTPEFVVLLYTGALSLFILLFAPFMATRHILLILPFLLLFGSGFIDSAAVYLNRITVSISLFLSIALGISDYYYADYYREIAQSIPIPQNSTTWSRGHWGWQWYAQKAGMKTYSTQNSKVKNGDFIIFPVNIPLQTLNNNLILIPHDTIWKEADWLTFFSVSNYGSLYSNSMKIPPWRYSTKPIDTVYIFRAEQIEE